MKKLLSLVGLIFLSLTLLGQSDVAKSSDDSFQYQLGTDISPLFRNLFKSDVNANTFLSVPYVLTFKSWKKDLAFRLGIGADIKKQISKSNSEDKILQNSFRVRMGFEKQRKISKRWQINTGVDLKFASSKFEDNLNNNFNNKSISYGIAPLLGIQFQLTPHLFLQTEAAFNLYYRTSTFDSNFDITFPNPFPGTFSQDLKSFGGFITIPNALLLVVEF